MRINKMNHLIIITHWEYVNLFASVRHRYNYSNLPLMINVTLKLFQPLSFGWHPSDNGDLCNLLPGYRDKGLNLLASYLEYKNKVHMGIMDCEYHKFVYQRKLTFVNQVYSTCKF